MTMTMHDDDFKINKMTRVWLSVSINGAILDRIVIQLFTDIVPKTCEK
jgi:hypothetical protein